MKKIHIDQVQVKHIYIVMVIFLALNYLDAAFTMYAMEVYKVPEMNPVTAKIMEDGTFITYKIVAVSLLAIGAGIGVRYINQKERNYAMAIVIAGALFYTVVNTLNFAFIIHFF